MSLYEQLAKEIISEAQDKVMEAAQQLLEDANREVPVQTGNLKASGTVVKTPNGAEVVYDAEYAIFVHENPDGRGYKWLERTLDANIQKYEDIIGGGDK